MYAIGVNKPGKIYLGLVSIMSWWVKRTAQWVRQADRLPHSQNWCLVSQAAQSVTIYRKKFLWTHTTMLGQLVPDARWLLAQRR
jgi:hypothetical protein